MLINNKLKNVMADCCTYVPFLNKKSIFSIRNLFLASEIYLQQEKSIYSTRNSIYSLRKPVDRSMSKFISSFVKSHIWMEKPIFISLKIFPSLQSRPEKQCKNMNQTFSTVLSVIIFKMSKLYECLENVTNLKTANVQIG